MELVPFYTMFAPVVGKDLAELLADGCSYSLPVSLWRSGRLFDALFLYKPGEGAGALPTGWILMDSLTGKLAVLADCEIMDFAEPGLLPPEASSQSHLEGLTPKKAAQMRLRVNDCYDEIRKFAFAEDLDANQAALVAEYKDLFLKLSAPEHYPYYYALSPKFFHWIRLPLPVHRSSVPIEENKVLEDPGKLMILEKLGELSRGFEEKIRMDGHKETLFDMMHTELQEYKNGLLDRLTMSMELDIIKTIDDVERSVAVFTGKQGSPEDYSRLLAILAGVATDLEDLLYRHGVEPYRLDGDSVDVMKQKILSTMDTGDPLLDKKIAKRMARGWEKQGSIIRPERISVYLYREENKE